MVLIFIIKFSILDFVTFVVIYGIKLVADYLSW